MTASNTYGRQVVLPLVNKSGGGVIAGDVVIVDTSNNDAFTTTTSAGFTGGIGIAQETIANNGTGRVLISGYAALVNVNASVTRGNYGKTYTVAKQATDAGATRTQGTFCQFLTGGTTPDAVMYPVDLAGAALTNPMTTSQDIIVGGASGTPGRLGIGSAGGSLVSLNSALAYNSGTSMPANKATGDRYWRTDLGLEFYWDGTRWLTTNLFVHDIGQSFDTLIFAALGTVSHTSRVMTLSPYLAEYLITLYLNVYVPTTNDGTKYWTIQLNSYNTAESFTAVGSSVNTSADAANAWLPKSVSLNTALATTAIGLTLGWTKTSTPGSPGWNGAITYRLIGT